MGSEMFDVEERGIVHYFLKTMGSVDGVTVQCGGRAAEEAVLGGFVWEDIRFGVALAQFERQE